MTSTRNVEYYRARARQWQEDADKLPEGHERDVCLWLADGYADLAMLTETRDLAGSGTLSAS